MNISFKIRNLEKVKKYISSLPRGVVFVALEAMSKWLVGDSQSGLRHPEPYKYVSRKSAYGVTFFTEKQRRWFFYALREGLINPGQNNRTGSSTEAWTYTPQEKGKNYTFKLVNNTPGAYWTRDDKMQARQLGKVGWWKVSKVVAKNLPGALRAARAAVKDYLAKK